MILISICDFPGHVEGIGEDSSEAFLHAENSPFDKIYLPEGYWNAENTLLRKHYIGSGKLITNGTVRGHEFVSIQEDPTPAVNPDFQFAATADTSKVNLSRFELGRIRNNLGEYYFNSATTPFWEDMVSDAGHSGTSAKFTNPLLVGYDALNLVAPCPEIEVGDTVKVTNDGAVHTAVCTYNSGTRLVFSPATSTNFTAVFTYGPTQTFGYVTKAIRTMNALRVGNVEHRGGGDSYVFAGRIIANNKYKQPSQDHFFETSTVGLFGGDLLSISNGSYMTGLEFNFSDANYTGSYQSAAVGAVMSFQRTADTGEYGATWMGVMVKSEASQHCDVAFRAYGKWKRGLDLTGVQYDGDKAAVTLERTSRIYFDSTSNTKDSRGFSWWADCPGKTWMGAGSGGDLIIAQNNTGRVFLEDSATRIRPNDDNSSVIFDKGYIDLHAKEYTGTVGVLDGYLTIKVNGIKRKIAIYQE